MRWRSAIFAVLLCLGCAGADRSGELGITLNWLSPVQAVSVRSRMTPQAELAGADLIRVTILGQFPDLVREFSLSKYPEGASISGIPIGSGIVVRVEALQKATGKVIYSASRLGVEIRSGRKTEVSMLMTREGEFSLLSPLNSPRAWAAQAVLADGRVLIAGGAKVINAEGNRWKMSPDGSLEVYRPEEGSFLALESELDIPRIFPTITPLSDGTLIVAGGMGEGWLNSDLTIQAESVTGSIEFFRPESGLVSDFGQLNFPRFLHTADLLGNGRILVAGGWGPDGQRIQTAEILDPESGGIEEVQMLTARAGHRSISLPGGLVLFWGGQETGPRAEIYSPGQGFLPFADGVSEPAVEYHTLDLVDDWILISGGVIRKPYLVLSDALLADSDPLSLDFILYLQSPRAMHASFRLPSGSICLAGGVQSISDLAGGKEVECYDPAAGKFQTAAELNEGRFGNMALGLPDGNALVLGGIVGNRESLEITFSAEIYNPPGW